MRALPDIVEGVGPSRVGRRGGCFGEDGIGRQSDATEEVGCVTQEGVNLHHGDGFFGLTTLVFVPASGCYGDENNYYKEKDTMHVCFFHLWQIYGENPQRKTSEMGWSGQGNAVRSEYGMKKRKTPTLMPIIPAGGICK